MKIFRLILWVFQGVIFLSCVEEVPLEEERFIKVLGKEGSSNAHSMKELQNGDLLIFGEMGVAAHKVVEQSNGPQFEEVEDQAPFIAITDPNGNLKKERSYPIEDLNLPGITRINPENNTIFLNVVERPSGGYIAHARIQNVDIIFNGQLSTNTSTPILFLLDDDLKVKKKIVITGALGWDFVPRTRGYFKEFSSGQYGLLCGYSEVDPTDSFNWPNGYSFYVFDEDLNQTQPVVDFLDAPNSLVAGHDFVVDQNNDLVVLGQWGLDAYLFKTPMSNLNKQNEVRIKLYDRIIGSGFDNNQHFISELPTGGYGVTFTNSPSMIVYQRIAIDGSVEVEEMIGPYSKFEDNIRSPRSQFMTKNGELLYYTIYIPDSDERVSSILYKVDQNGATMFERPFEGTPGAAIESSNGNILVVSNILYNKSLPKIHIYKLSSDGKLF